MLKNLRRCHKPSPEKAFGMVFGLYKRVEQAMGQVAAKAKPLILKGICATRGLSACAREPLYASALGQHYIPESNHPMLLM